ncbi:MAG: hypothetical protein U0M06_01775 [Clostridia bacterium]|nr:hypothetical protein [Clostridia bacterium]
MADFNCRNNCTIFAVAASIIIGIITAFLRITGTITVTNAFLWVTFGIAVVYTAVALLTLLLIGRRGGVGCVGEALTLFLTGILGTLLTSVVLLAVSFVATSVVGAIISGLLLAFFTLIFASAACLVKCIVGIDD